MERIIGHHIMNHLLLNNLLSKHQHGFVWHLSTTTNLLEYMDIITGALNEWYVVDVVYLDFSGSIFDLCLRLWLRFAVSCLNFVGSFIFLEK